MFDIAITEGLFITWDFVLLIAVATVMGYIAHKTYQPNLIAYLITGLILGPVFLDVVQETALLELMSELGLAFLLFLLGLQLKFDAIRNILKPILKISFWQTVLQTSLAFVIYYFLGFAMIEVIVMALCTVFGATPVIVKLLDEKDEINSLPGKIDVGVLIVQDIILVVYLTLFSAPDLTNPVPIAINFFQVMGVMAVLGVFSYAVSKWMVPKIVKEVGNNKHLLFVNGAAWAFLFIAVSLALDVPVEVGAFIAGLGLAQSPYSDELKQQVKPITDFFMMVFFATIGLGLAPEYLTVYWKEAVVASALLMVGNFLIMFYLIDREKFSLETSFLGSINMVQVSEFSLVVGALAVTRGLIGNEIMGYLSLMAIMTMGLSAYIIKYNHWIYDHVKHLFEFMESEEKGDFDIKTLDNHAIVVGYNEITRRLIPVLKEKYGDIVVIDKDPKYVEMLRKSGAEFVFGDLKHEEMRRSIGLKRADMIVSMAMDNAVNRRILGDRKEGAVVFLRARDREDAAELYDLGADFVIIKRMLSAEKMNEYIESFLENPDLFDKAVEGDKQIIDWEARL